MDMDSYIPLEIHNKILISRVRRSYNNPFANASFNITFGVQQKNFTDFCEAGAALTLENVAYACFTGFLLLSSFIGNSLVIGATCSSKRLRIRVTVYFILSLAISDFLTAISIIPFYISKQFHRQQFCHGLGACYWMLLGESSGTVASILNLFFIALDRFIAIRFPYSHPILFSTRRVKKMIIGIWMFAVVYPITGVFPWSAKYSQLRTKTSITNVNNVCTNHNRPYFAVSFLGIYIVPLAVMTFTYCMILQIAISQIRAIESTQIDSHLLSQEDENSINNNPTECSRKRKQKRIKRKELKATKSVAIVYTAFLVCWLPACIINIILLSDVYYFPRLLKTNRNLFLFIWYGLIQFLPMISTMVNPLIYSFSNKRFREGIKTISHQIWCFGEIDSSIAKSRRVTKEIRNNSSLISNSPQSVHRTVLTIETENSQSDKTSSFGREKRR